MAGERNRALPCVLRAEEVEVDARRPQCRCVVDVGTLSLRQVTDYPRSHHKTAESLEGEIRGVVPSGDGRRMSPAELGADGALLRSPMGGPRR